MPRRPIQSLDPTGSQSPGGDWQFAQLCPGHGQVIAIAVRRPVERPIILDAKEIHPSLL